MSTLMPPSPWKLDPSLKRLPKACREWLPREFNQPSRYLERIQEFLDKAGVVDPKIIGALSGVWHPYSMAACDAYFRSDADDLARFLNWSIAFGALYYRLGGTFVAMRTEQKGTGFAHPLWDSNRAAAPCMLRDWPVAEVCAAILIRDLENDQAFEPNPKQRWYWHGSNDAFYGYFFADAFGIDSHYQSAAPLVAPYQQLLQHWRTEDRGVFQRVMQEAAAFHISRSKHGTDKTTYEFEKYVDRVFPPELLAVQALRQRLGLPAFEAGHRLIDASWAVLQALPAAEPHPLAVAVETRLRLDYPLFR